MYRIPGWIFTKLGKDKVLMTPNICIDFGPNPPGVDPGQDHNRSMRGPSPKDFLLRVGRL